MLRFAVPRLVRTRDRRPGAGLDHASRYRARPGLEPPRRARRAAPLLRIYPPLSPRAPGAAPSPATVAPAHGDPVSRAEEEIAELLQDGIRWPERGEANFWERPPRTSPPPFELYDTGGGADVVHPRDRIALHIVHITGEPSAAIYATLFRHAFSASGRRARRATIRASRDHASRVMPTVV